MTVRLDGRRRATLAALALLMVGALATLPLQGAGKALITINDLRWQGTYAFPQIGTATPGGPGTTNYASGAVAVRYVNGQRRILMPTFTQVDPASGQMFGDLVEWQEPSEVPYLGADPSQAPKMIETRRWKNWTVLASNPAWHEKTNGVRVGGLLWDEATGVLWYQLYAYYSGRNHPFLGATRLLDTPTIDNYREVGPQYGPWWYRNNDPGETTHLYWKSVCNWIIKVPGDSQADLKGNVILGGTVGAVGGAGNLGPGFRAIPGLPALTDAPNSVVATGRRLADYTNESPVRPPHARRGDNYSFDGAPLSASESGLYPPSGGRGYWQMSLDQINSFIWVDTPLKEGILMFGRQATGLTWYGFSPRSSTPGWNSLLPDAIDPSRGTSPGNGYGSTAWRAALYVFDPAQVREVGRGARSPWSDGINPAAVYDWAAQWPNLPRNGGRGSSARPIESTISNSGFWDDKAGDVIWIQPSSVAAGSPQPTLNLFRLGPRTAVNPRIVG